MHPLPRSFYNRNAEVVARDLLGKLLLRRIGRRECIARIVEVEAYLGPHDRASHSSRGVTARTRVMFGPAGHAYVYLIYGMHHCLNVVTGCEGEGAAVLVRAVEPIQNIADRTSGPGLLCRALQIDRRHNDLDLLGPELFLAEPAVPAPFAIDASPRIGVDYAGWWARRHLRFFIRNNSHVSRR